MDRSAVSVVIPCLDEEAAIGACVAAVRAHGVGEVIVVDGGSADRTAERAAQAGARVVVERRRGYGRAMLAGLAAIAPNASIILFIDGDGSDRPEMVPGICNRGWSRLPMASAPVPCFRRNAASVCFHVGKWRDADD